MANPTCRSCDRSVDAGAYRNSCAAGIMISALNSHLHRSQDPRQATQALSSACSGSPDLALRRA